MQLDLSAGPSISLAYLAFGLTTQIDLGVLAAPGCSVNVYPIVTIVAGTDASGRASLAVGVPNETVLVGSEVGAQWFMVDRPANGLGVITSTSVGMKIGSL